MYNPKRLRSKACRFIIVAVTSCCVTALNISSLLYLAFFVADLMPVDQRTLGFSIQTVLIGIGAVIGSFLPYVLAEWFDVSDQASTGGVPLNVKYSFIVGAIVLIITVLITIFTTKEYSPEEMKMLDEYQDEDSSDVEEKSGLKNIFSDFVKMPETMRQLAWVQFFSWFGLFSNLPLNA